jgi:hypothetical protein
MSTASGFAIQWNVSDKEWSNAQQSARSHGRGSDYDTSHLSCFNDLYGNLQIRGSGGGMAFEISILDFAWSLAKAGLEGAFSRGDGMVYDQANDNLHVYFDYRGDSVTIRNNLGTAELSASRSEVEAAIASFLCEFTRELSQRAPALYGFDGMVELREFASKSCRKGI